MYKYFLLWCTEYSDEFSVKLPGVLDRESRDLFPEWLASDCKELGVQGVLSLVTFETEPLSTTAESTKFRKEDNMQVHSIFSSNNYEPQLLWTTIIIVVWTIKE